MVAPAAAAATTTITTCLLCRRGATTRTSTVAFHWFEVILMSTHCLDETRSISRQAWGRGRVVKAVRMCTVFLNNYYRNV
jgi:hypothetical protein